jgi:hypothetical protein
MSSPANFQGWIRSDRPLDDAEKRYWLRKFGSDPGATPRGRWGRMPGFRKRKPQSTTADGWPLAKLAWRSWTSNTTPGAAVWGLDNNWMAGRRPVIRVVHSLPSFRSTAMEPYAPQPSNPR